MKPKAAERDSKEAEQARDQVHVEKARKFKKERAGRWRRASLA
jgi:hypothetical protein